MASRLKLHEELCRILGSNSVYFNSPESPKMYYPAIKYSLTGADLKRANDGVYKMTPRYEVIVIDQNPDSEIWTELIAHFPMCKFDRSYTADNLKHFVLTLHY